MKRKIVNDPVHGLINLPDGLPFELMEHPYMQRLRRIKQTGLLHLVYPGSVHSRFHHALGVSYLMGKAIETLRMKGHAITHEEAEAASVVALLHDIGHAPFSHSLEYTIVNTHHEKISACFFDDLNRLFDNRLEMAKAIFNNQYPKKFLYQLISGQIDVDRMDYLQRDSFFTGVAEGVIAADRIINMFEVQNDNLVVEEKGLYSVENFLIARRLMYWQVYLHKTVIVSDFLLINILRRAKELSMQQIEVAASPPLLFFLQHHCSESDFYNNPAILQHFSELDDFDVFAAIKQWRHHPDKILSYLSDCLVNRHLFAIEMSNTPFSDAKYEQICLKIKRHFNISDAELPYFIIRDAISNNMYDITADNILILKKDNSLIDIAEATDQMSIKKIAVPVTKYALSYPKMFR
jgi:HD superfamily phosphohydrolase